MNKNIDNFILYMLYLGLVLTYKRKRKNIWYNNLINEKQANYLKNLAYDRAKDDMEKKSSIILNLMISALNMLEKKTFYNNISYYPYNKKMLQIYENYFENDVLLGIFITKVETMRHRNKEYMIFDIYYQYYIWFIAEKYCKPWLLKIFLKKQKEYEIKNKLEIGSSMNRICEKNYNKELIDLSKYRDLTEEDKKMKKTKGQKKVQKYLDGVKKLKIEETKKKKEYLKKNIKNMTFKEYVDYTKDDEGDFW